MSKYAEIKCEFKDADVLVKALAEVGYSEVELHTGEGKNLVGYHGDTRKEKANVIVRRKFVGGASNDIGFKLNASGSYDAIISEYDSYKHNDAWMSKLKVSYSELTYKKKAMRMGFRFVGKIVENGKTELKFVKA
jgi:hypothetical protein